MSELVIVLTHHVVDKFLFKLFSVLLASKLDPVRFFDFDFELVRSFAHVVVDGIGNTVDSVRLFVDHDPLTSEKMSSLRDWKLPQSVFITPNHLILGNHLRGRKDIGHHLNRILVNHKIPIFDGFLTEKLSDHLLDPSDLFLRIDSRLGKSISHTWSLSYAVWNTIK